MTTKAAPVVSGDAGCATCPAYNAEGLVRLGVNMANWDHVVALAGNPNTGKSTVFNNLTGLRQRTGNWPGKTVTRAEGGFSFGGARYKLVDLPGTYSLLSASTDEEIARDFILFGQPDVTVIVVDATCLERNLNLALQVLEITERVVICLNLMDEAERHGLQVDPRRLSRDLGVPVVATSARSGEGMDELIKTIAEVAAGQNASKPHRLKSLPPAADRAVTRVAEQLLSVFPELPNARWVAMRLLDGDPRMAEAIRTRELGELGPPEGTRLADRLLAVRDDQDLTPETILEQTNNLRWEIGGGFHDDLMEAIYSDAHRITDRAITVSGEKPRFDMDRSIDRIVTSRTLGFPMMIALFALVIWITIVGANVPSSMLATLLLDNGHPFLKGVAASIGMPGWLDGLLIDGTYLGLAWVISVMLPPMAIFFPLFTMLEDFGYLPRVAFNMDRLFRKAGAHGKQALTMSMGYGCNAAGVIATRVIDSPRERLIAIITNNFALCNGRWPTQILIATIFVGAVVPAHLAGLASAGMVMAVALLGILLTFVVSWALSRTVLKGEASAFSLELPPYRPPRLMQTLYTSLIDRTIFVLWRAIIFAAPAGAVTWLIANINIGDMSLAGHIVGFLEPFGLVLGLNGVILLAYIVAIPANEIIVPTILMLTVMTARIAGAGEGAGVMFELDSASATEDILRAGGWTLLTGVNLMIFSLLHNPCSTTIYTIWKETKSVKWTTVSSLLPVGMGLLACFVVAQVWRVFTS
ncbi:MAG: ferrous iron transport protein B [Gemmatimonadetes bacterium]|nr:ferrous iron transport protein B [Gemmatimonadota bacterium]